MKEITVQELKHKIDSKDDFQLIDVREEYEVEAAHINGIHIPMATVPDNLDKIAKDKMVVIHCRSGARSANICNYLMQNGYTEVYNLKGGIKAYAADIDNTLRPV